jgi:hypothetical protein
MTIEQLQVLQLGTVSIPTSATIGATRMRVWNIMESFSLWNFPYGQVEDYTVIIDGAAFNAVNSTSANDNSGFDFYSITEPSDFINISSNQYKEGSYKIYNSQGFEIQNGNTSGDAVNVSSLTEGIYFFNLEKTFVKPFKRNNTFFLNNRKASQWCEAFFQLLSNKN